ncbi:hypothetical protein TSUD_256180 [Trifolium subterraneum]|uniref:Uncharacterized protein n=1 Tax=Trifolium subterraneum TaxID=3900 RepID=A0A2Z6MX58_TRISU|nr:hypothetical protein TSUD_256180 [Trifolium subterraneum]
MAGGVVEDTSPVHTKDYDESKLDIDDYSLHFGQDIWTRLTMNTSYQRGMSNIRTAHMVIISGFESCLVPV